MSSGLNLLESAISESQYPNSDNQAFARQLYINGLTYLLRGLPSQLSASESLSLQSALPGSLQAGVINGVQTSSSNPSVLRSRSEPTRSLLHRLLASGIVQLFLTLSFLLPHIKVLLRAIYRYERSHRLSERVFAASVDAVDGFGRRGVGVVDAILNSGNGRVGELLAACVAWWIEGISGGVKEGVDEGLIVLGMRGS